jgi:hypothetical protein
MSNHQILGVADDGQAYFIDDSGRMQSSPLKAINKPFLMVLRDREYWKLQNPKKDNVDWDEAANDIIVLSKLKDFNPDFIKGRGAWRSKSGEVCYFDGNKTTGNPDERFTFTRKVKKDIGLSAKHTSPEVRNTIYKTNKRLLYSNKEEAGKMLAWATLAPFGGALFWRPACFLTGASNAGKSAIVDLITKPLLGPYPEVFSGGGSTEAGVRQKIMNDASPVVLEETEDDTQKKKDNKEALLSLMRQSTSDDTPIMAKGTSDQKGATFTLRSMFMFVGISPEVSSEADDNRLFRVNMMSAPEGGDKDWPEKRDLLKELLSEENTNGIRAFTFDHLGEIIDIAHRIQPMIQDVTKENSRFAMGESLLISCLIIVYLCVEKPSDTELKEVVTEFYKDHKKVEKVNDVENILVRILDQKIKVYEEEVKGEYTPRQILTHLRDDKMGSHDASGSPTNNNLGYAKRSELNKIMANNGLGIYNGKKEGLKGQVAFAKNHPGIKKSLEGGSYYELLKRHEKFLGEEKICMAGKTRDCVILGGLLE